MSANTRALGLGNTLEYEGKTYQLKPMSLEQITLFEAWVEEQQWAAHRRTRHILDADEYAENAKTLRRECGMGVYGYPQPAWWEASLSVPGIKHIFWLVLHKEHEELTPELIDKIVMTKLEELTRSFMEANDPTDPTVATSPSPV